MDYMKRALALANQAVGKCSPNPPVGAVLVKNGQVVGEGFTQPPGGPHAEIAALRHAGERARGAILYVTLEPCCHQGRTPPCTDAIRAAGVSGAHMAAIDPNPLVNGKGKAQLEAAGISVVVGEREEEARTMAEAHFKYIVTRLPFVTAKFAMSLDGKLATASGDSQWITGEASRERAHQLRAATDAIMVGINTALKDDPQLTARDGERPLERQPLRVIVDSRGRLPLQARVLTAPGKTLVAAARLDEKARHALEQKGAEVVALPAEDGRVDLQGLLRILGQREVTSLLVEGGGTLLGSLFDARLVDKVVAFIAPKILGGREAITPVEGIGVAMASQAVRLARVKVERVGEEIVVTGYVGR